MTTDKAREFFSAYFEGSLDEGLKLGLEQTMRRDAGLREEYELFARTMKELELMGDAEVEVPMDLHERILSRIETATAKKTLPPLVLWRNLAFGAVAAALIIGSFFSLKGRFEGGSIPAGLTGGGSATQPSAPVKPLFKFEGGQLKVVVQSDTDHVLRVESAPDMKALRVAAIPANQAVEAPLTNPQADARAFYIKILSQANDLYAALPGSTLDTKLTGEGTVLDFSLAVAGHYRVPVVIAGSLANEKTKWDFTNVSVNDAVKSAMGQSGAPAQALDSGLVRIGDF